MFLTVKQIAQRAHVCERVVRGWIKDGLLDTYRFGSKGKRGKVLVKDGDLDALLESFRVAGGAQPPAPASPPPSEPLKLKHLTLPSALPGGTRPAGRGAGRR
jgi:hypothetical protein